MTHSCAPHRGSSLRLTRYRYRPPSRAPCRVLSYSSCASCTHWLLQCGDIVTVGVNGSALRASDGVLSSLESSWPYMTYMSYRGNPITKEVIRRAEGSTLKRLTQSVTMTSWAVQWSMLAVSTPCWHRTRRRETSWRASPVSESSAVWWHRVTLMKSATRWLRHDDDATNGRHAMDGVDAHDGGSRTLRKVSSAWNTARYWNTAWDDINSLGETIGDRETSATVPRSSGESLQVVRSPLSYTTHCTSAWTALPSSDLGWNYRR